MNISESTQTKVKLGWVLRDMMQSTGVWTFDPVALQSLVRQAVEVGFSSLEIGGGQSYQIALENGVNPYQLLRNAKQTIDECGATLPLQVLLRGANQLGFQHYDAEIQHKNIDLLVDAAGDSDKANTVIIRNFDALNDAENLRASLEYMVRRDRAAAEANRQAVSQQQPASAKRIHIQAALSYVSPKSDDELACYSTAYYVGYAKKLIAMAEAAGGQLDSICIKDMSGQLSPAVILDLVPRLKALGLPLFLHCHSTDEAKSMAVQVAAIQNGIDGIEVAIEPLAGGASHNDIENLCYLDGVVQTQSVAIVQLKRTLDRLFSESAIHRRDSAIPQTNLRQLVKLGIPGGAIPFVVKDLVANTCSIFGVELEQALVLFGRELQRIQGLLGNVPLVTPTADIIAKQTIKSLGNQKRSKTYQLMDPRFCHLVLGHYGEVINHATDQRVEVAASLVDEIIEYCAAIDKDINGQRCKAGKVYPEPMVLSEHPTRVKIANRVKEDQTTVYDYIVDLFQRYPQSCENFGSLDECFMMHIMRPAGKTDRLLTNNILGPTEARLRLILLNTLELLLGNDVPESRLEQADEQTDGLLLDALGDYDGIVESIRDLVLNGDQASIRRRLNKKMQSIIDPIVAVNEDASQHRYYIERRFVSLFAAAVFWDLQRVCRRTGSDSRAAIDEMTARKLDKIISSTLRKRQSEGRGPAKRYLT